MRPDLAKEFSKKTPKGIKLPKKLANPRTDDERKARHHAKYGTYKLPPRGTGRNIRGER